jgi:hypothetical protein
VGAHGLVVGSLEDGDQIVASFGPVGSLLLQAMLLGYIIAVVGTLHGLPEVSYPLFGPVDQDYVCRRPLPLSPRGYPACAASSLNAVTMVPPLRVRCYAGTDSLALGEREMLGSSDAGLCIESLSEARGLRGEVEAAEWICQPVLDGLVRPSFVPQKRSESLGTDYRDQRRFGEACAKRLGRQLERLGHKVALEPLPRSA